MAYVIANPTTAGLVPSPEQWPGLITRRLGETLTFELPDHFFDDDALEDDEAVLECVRPDIFPHLSDAELNQKLFDAVATRTRHTRAEMRRAGKKFLGAEGVLRQAFSAKPETTEIRRKLSPRIAASNPNVRVAAIRALQRFLAEYREAWNAWRNGNRDALFPFGTYSLRVHARAPCAELASA